MRFSISNRTHMLEETAFTQLPYANTPSFNCGWDPAGSELSLRLGLCYHGNKKIHFGFYTKLTVLL